MFLVPNIEIINFFNALESHPNNAAMVGQIKEIIMISKYNKNILEKLEIHYAMLNENNYEKMDFNKFKSVLEIKLSNEDGYIEIMERLDNIDVNYKTDYPLDDYPLELLINTNKRMHFKELDSLISFFDSKKKNNSTKPSITNNDNKILKRKKFTQKQTIELLKIFERFSNKNIYKCICFVFANDTTIKNLFERNKEDLNIESGDYLDLFYSNKSLKTSGIKLKKAFPQFKFDGKDIPCIMIWKDDMDNAECISLKNLNETGILYIILEIIALIKESNASISCKTISKKCNKKVEEFTAKEMYTKAKEKGKFLWMIIVPLAIALISGITSVIIDYLLNR